MNTMYIVAFRNYSDYEKMYIVHCRAGKPPPGLHLDVMKDGKMIQVASST